MPKGLPRRITERPIFAFFGLAWTRDGKSALVVEGAIPRLWRVAIDGTTPPSSIDLAGLSAFHPAVAASRDRLVFAQRVSGDTDISRFEVGRTAEPILASSFADLHPSLSPDGRRVAFESSRSGEGHEIWLADADGANPAPLTHGPGLAQGSPRWSPDGRHIAFDSQGEDGHRNIWTIESDGGAPRRLTQSPGEHIVPSWSGDGRSVYFAASQAGATDVWRIPAAGGAEERMTQGGGIWPSESTDGRTLYFMRETNHSPLLALPLAGGPDRSVVDCVSGFTVGPAGIYYPGCQAGAETPLFLRDPATGRERLLGRLRDNLDKSPLTVSPDCKTILYTSEVKGGADVMMIDNFR